MRFTQSWLAVGAIVVSVTLPNGSWAKSALDARVSRLENILENEIDIDLINQLEGLQQEIRELRGQIEEQRHALHNMHSSKEVAANIIEQEVTNSVEDVNLEPVTIAPVTVETTPLTEESESVVQGDEKSAYDVAYRNMSNKQYQLALTEFKDLLWQYPEGVYAPNAYYWMGEIYLSQWQQNKEDRSVLMQAKEAFNAVLTKYTEHHKAVDALLKLGFIELDQENWQVAKELFTRVIKEHPGSSRARLAEARLQRMQQEGRL